MKKTLLLQLQKRAFFQSYFFKCIICNLIAFSNICDIKASHDEAIKSNGIQLGISLLEQNEFVKAENEFQHYILSLTDVAEKSSVIYEVAKLYNSKLYFDLSIDYCLEGIQLINNDSFDKHFYKTIAINHIDLGNYDQAEYYFHQSQKVNETFEEYTVNDYNLIGEIFRLKGDVDVSIEHFKKAISKNIDIKKADDLVVSYNSLGLSYLVLKDYMKASFYLNKSLELIDSLKMTHRKQAISISFGDLYLQQNKYEKAIYFYRQTIRYDLQNHPDRVELLKGAHYGLWKTYEQIESYKEALNAYKEYQKYSQKLFDRDKQATIFQHQILSERTVHKNEIRLLENKSLLERKYYTILLFLFGAAILLIAFFAYTLVLRFRSVKQKVEIEKNKSVIQELEIAKSKVENEKLQAEIIQTDQESKIKVLEYQKLKDEIDSKNRELSSSTIHLSNKNEILQAISEKVKKFKPTEIGDKNLLKDVESLIKENIQFDQDWEVFKKHFVEVHPEFFEQLLHSYNDLTSEELKLCAFIKIQLSSKVIARLLHITVPAVNKRRNRIRKKFAITSDVDLYEFMILFNKPISL